MSARVLPVVEVESRVAHPRAAGHCVVLCVGDGVSSHRGGHHLVLVKVDSNLEGSREAAS